MKRPPDGTAFWREALIAAAFVLPACKEPGPAPRLFSVHIGLTEVEGLVDDMHLGVLALCGSTVEEIGLDPASLSLDSPPDIEGTATLTIDPAIYEVTWGARRYCASGELEAWAWVWVDSNEDGHWNEGEVSAGARQSEGDFGFTLYLDGAVAS